ncbi:TRAP transporter small permease [Salinicoccus hispanicus]|uniref:TRAP transporter small permease subunit n=1 Tax=Salinicoccus hispanicus TaxID=157225 RepID=A0A6N8U0V6_9STAP|nr:TRAP transporter small permease [Salinicoccus hispanicus]MXQ51383.1 TRAP transporter small permease subunit [Salinicoccus hispanicus]
MQKLIRAVEKIQIILGLIFLLVFFISILIQIATRYLGVSVIWTEEMANYSFIWAIFMGAAVMVNRKEHFTFDILQKKLSPKYRIFLNLFIDIILIVFNALLFFYSIEILERFWNYNWTSLPFLKMGYVWITIPIMTSTMVLYSINHVINGIRTLRSSGGEEVPD